MKEIKDIIVTWYMIIIVAIILLVATSCTSSISFTKTEHQYEKPKNK